MFGYQHGVTSKLESRKDFFPALYVVTHPELKQRHLLAGTIHLPHSNHACGRTRLDTYFEMYVKFLKDSMMDFDVFVAEASALSTNPYLLVDYSAHNKIPPFEAVLEHEFMLHDKGLFFSEYLHEHLDLSKELKFENKRPPITNLYKVWLQLNTIDNIDKFFQDFSGLNAVDFAKLSTLRDEKFINLLIPKLKLDTESFMITRGYAHINYVKNSLEAAGFSVEPVLEMGVLFRLIDEMEGMYEYDIEHLMSLNDEGKFNYLRDKVLGIDSSFRYDNSEGATYLAKINTLIEMNNVDLSSDDPELRDKAQFLSDLAGVEQLIIAVTDTLKTPIDIANRLSF